MNQGGKLRWGVRWDKLAWIDEPSTTLNWREIASGMMFSLPGIWPQLIVALCLA